MFRNITTLTFVEFADNEGELYGPFETEEQLLSFIKMTEQFRGEQVEWWPRFRVKDKS